MHGYSSTTCPLGMAPMLLSLTAFTVSYAVTYAGPAAYPPLYPNFGLSALDTPLKYHEQELSYAGISLKNLVRSGKKVCDYSAADAASAQHLPRCSPSAQNVVTLDSKKAQATVLSCCCLCCKMTEG
jgi:hypothetical protein